MNKSILLYSLLILTSTQHIQSAVEISTWASIKNSVENHKNVISIALICAVYGICLYEAYKTYKTARADELRKESIVRENAKIKAELEAEENAKKNRIKAFFKAIENQDIEQVRHLIKNGADVHTVINKTYMVSNRDYMTKYGSTVLGYAIQIKANIHIIKILIDAGADVKLGNDQTTCLMLAARKNYPECIDLLIKSGAQVNATRIEKISILGRSVDRDTGHTALVDAARNDNTECIKLLIKAGANVNVPSHIDGTTALLVAVTEKRIENIKILLAAGAQVNIINGARHETVLDRALYPAVPSKAIINLLRSYGAKTGAELQAARAV